MTFSVRLEGGEELEKFLSQFPVNTERKFLVAGLRGPAKMFKESIRSQIKTNFKTKTGTLLRSVRHRTGKAKYGAYVVIESGSIEADTGFIKNAIRRKAKVAKLKTRKASGKYADAFYSRFLIQGTNAHKIEVRKGGKRTLSSKSTIYGRAAKHPGLKEKPIFDRALVLGQNMAEQEFNLSLIQAFEREAKRILKSRK